MRDRDPVLVERMRGFGTTIFAEMSALAVETGAINLGQGFPDTDGPNVVLEAAVAAIRSGHNQYPPGDGIPELRRAVAAHQEHWYGLEWDPDGEVLATAGATEAIAASVLALCDAGDEVVALEPFYDSYQASAALAGARLVGVPMRPPQFTFDPAELEAAVTERTRMLLVNSPHNPLGRVLDPGELEALADVARRHDLIVVTDEVYEHLAFDTPHTPMATLPEMAERTITISSAAKTFSVTGWKIGWLTAPRHLVDAVRTVKQFLTYTNGSPFQPAIAGALGLDDATFEWIRADLRAKRDVLSAGLEAVGFGVTPSEGTYFVTADLRPLGADDGMAFCRELPHRAGVVAIPHEVFWERKEIGRPYVRFAFSKRPDVLREACARLGALA